VAGHPIIGQGKPPPWPIWGGQTTPKSALGVVRPSLKGQRKKTKKGLGFGGDRTTPRLAVGGGRISLAFWEWLDHRQS
jgi:hypothetical protein